MRKIVNPWHDDETNHCFGSSPRNPHGLHLEFYEDGEDILCVWQPKTDFQSWLNTLHGGIQCALMDETGAWVVIDKLKTSAVTYKLESKFLKVVHINQGTISIRARLKEVVHNIAHVECEIRNVQNEICAKADISYLTFPRDVAIDKFNFRDPDIIEDDTIFNTPY